MVKLLIQSTLFLAFIFKMLFDKDGNLIAQKINQEISHEEDYDLYDEIPPIRKLNKKYIELVKFVYKYVQNHVYLSKKMVSGLYIVKINPKYNRADTQAYQKVIKTENLVNFEYLERIRCL